MGAPSDESTQVNSCETLYRDGFDYNVEVSRLLGSRQSSSIGATPVRDSPPARLEEPGPRSTIPRPSYEPERLWVGQPEAVSHQFSDYQLSSESGYGSKYRLSANVPPRHHGEAYYPLAAPAAPFYGGTGQTTTLAFRPANMVSAQPTSAVGPYPSPPIGSREASQRMMNERTSPQQHAAYTSPRRPLPSSSAGYYTTPTSPGYSRVVPSPPEGHSSPLSIDANGYARFDVTSLYHPVRDVVEVKMESDGASQQNETQQASLEHSYQYTDTAHYRNVESTHIPVMLPVPHTLPSHGPLELIQPSRQGAPKESHDISRSSSGRGK